MKKRLVALMMALVMAGSSLAGMTVKADTCGGLESVDVYNPGEYDSEGKNVVPDPILHWAIRASMNSINLPGKILTKEMVASPSVKDISYELCAHPEDFETNEWKGKQYWIDNLEGLQYATSARMIDIAYTNLTDGKRIADLSPIKDLTQLETLILKQNGIDDISDISNLVNLKKLDLSANDLITDVSAIAGMTKLASLDLSNNAIESVDALENLSELTYVQLSNNKVTKLPNLSKLTKVYFLDVSGNELTDEAILEIGKMKNLVQLNLSGNEKITDYRALANLTKLDKSATTIPAAEKKADLFAAIEVNKLFEKFNISKMSMDDLEDVEIALKAYEALTDEQKTYMDTAKIEAAASNKALVESGQDPVEYPEYDFGEKEPEFKKLEILVVDKYGKAMPNVEFHKKARDAQEPYETFTTNEKGKFVIKHKDLDMYRGEIVVVPAGDKYMAEPSELTYEVDFSLMTKTINGKKATGLEELKIVLILKEDYVDKAELKEALAKAEAVEREYKYTAESYKVYADALEAAQGCMDNVDATKEAVAETAQALNAAIAGLTYSDVLTQLKIKVIDTNGNTFHRAFKFQIRVPETQAEAWNDFTCPYSGTAYLKTSLGWEDGKEWEIVACYEEPYEIEPFKVTIGVTEDGQRYFKTVEGKPVDVHFEKVVVASYLPEEAAGRRLPDRKIVEEAIDYANEVNILEYTASTAKKLTEAVNAAKAILEKQKVIQEEYNKVIADILVARDELVKAADKYLLEEELFKVETYNKTVYTSASWSVFQDKVKSARDVYEDGDATQKAVDEALALLKEAPKALILKADTSVLLETIKEAEKIDTDMYTAESCEVLSKVIAASYTVYNKEDATQDEVNDQVKVLQNTIAGLEKKPQEPEYDCYPYLFRAKVVDKDGKAIAGVGFKVVIDGVTLSTELKSDENGIITYEIPYSSNGKTTYINLSDERYETTDTHYFTVTGTNEYIYGMHELDGKIYDPQVKTNLKYVVKPAGEEDEQKPEPQPVCQHSYKAVTTRATTGKDGNTKSVCSKCKSVKSGSTIIIPRVDKVKLSTTKYTYSGETRKPKVTVTDRKGKTISSKYYTVSYSSGRKKVGQYTVKVTFKGNYSGTKTATFVINPKKTSISKVSKAKKAFTVKWKKQSKEVTGYQIQYSTDKKFKKSVKTTTVSKYKTTSKKISKLKAKKTYYVRVRTYKTVKVNGKSVKFYSGWSAAKSVKTK